MDSSPIINREYFTDCSRRHSRRHTASRIYSYRTHGGKISQASVKTLR